MEETLRLVTDNAAQTTELRLVGFDRVERRSEPRVSGPFPATVIDVASEDNSFQPVLENLSASGFYLRTNCRARVGQKLLVSAIVSQAIVVLCGQVLRVEDLEDGTCGLAASILQYRIFSETEINASDDKPLVVAEFLRRTEA